MQCNHCGKIVPNTVKTCTFCNEVIDPNGHYIAPEEDLGSSDNIYNDKKFDLKVVNEYIKEPSKKKYVFMIGGVALVVVIIVIALIASIFSGGKVDGKQYFLGVSDAIYEYVEQNIFDRKGHTGRASVKFTLNESYKAFAQGDYTFDPMKDYYSYDAKLDGNYSDEDIKVSSDILPFVLVLDGNNLSLTSEELGEKTIISDISLISKYLNFEDYDAKKVVSSLHDALDDSIKNAYISTSKETINFRGEGVKVNKANMHLDGKGMTKFVDSYLDSLLASNKFLTEFSTIRGENKNKTKEYLNNLKKTFEYNHGNSYSNTLDINIYFNKTKVYKIEGIFKTNKEYKITLEVSTNKYYFDYFVDNKNVYSGSLSHVVSVLNKVTHGEIIVTFDKDGLLTDLDVKYDDDLKPTYTKKKLNETVDIASFTDEEFGLLHETFSGFIKYNKWFKDYRDIFATECTSSLECNCGETTCMCELDDKIITCPINRIK